MPVFSEYFDVLEKRENGAVLRPVTPLGEKRDYLETEDTCALFETLRYLDRVLIEEVVLEPSGIE